MGGRFLAGNCSPAWLAGRLQPFLWFGLEILWPPLPCPRPPPQDRRFCPGISPCAPPLPTSACRFQANFTHWLSLWGEAWWEVINPVVTASNIWRPQAQKHRPARSQLGCPSAARAGEADPRLQLRP